jgi:hypothetical protein
VARILREIKGGLVSVGGFYSGHHDIWAQVNGFTYNWRFDNLDWRKFLKDRSCLYILNAKSNIPEYFIFLYETKFYLSEIELSNEEFMIVLQKEVLSKKDKLKDALEKIKAEAEAEGYSRKSIPKDVQVFVWNRDGGKCVNCGSNENLEYDHIIPVSKGGSNTARNIQLLCRTCNRAKSNKIGEEILSGL